MNASCEPEREMPQIDAVQFSRAYKLALSWFATGPKRGCFSDAEARLLADVYAAAASQSDPDPTIF